MKKWSSSQSPSEHSPIARIQRIILHPVWNYRLRHLHEHLAGTRKAASLPFPRLLLLQATSGAEQRLQHDHTPPWITQPANRVPRASEPPMNHEQRKTRSFSSDVVGAGKPNETNGAVAGVARFRGCGASGDGWYLGISGGGGRRGAAFVEEISRRGMLYAQAQIPLRHWLAYSATSRLRPPSSAGGRRRGGGVRGAARSREHATTEGAAGATTSAISSSSAVAGASGQRELLMARRDLVTCSTECFIGRRPRAGNTTVHSLQRAASLNTTILTLRRYYFGTRC